VDTVTVGDLRIPAPDLDPRDLDPVTDPPDDDLVEAKVDGASWHGLRLGGGRVSQSHLVAVDLSDAAWRNVSLYGCRLERVDLSNARLAGLRIERCAFVGCRMTGVQLVDATLKNVIFEDCRLDYANVTDSRATGPTAWIRCLLAHAVLTNCRLPATAFSECQLGDVELVDCDLRGSDLRGNDLSGVAGLASLRGAVIEPTQLTDLAVIAAKDLGLDVRG
jgi:uncharacterized protein YjbI with pentapeptide repeats